METQLQFLKNINQENSQEIKTCKQNYLEM